MGRKQLETSIQTRSLQLSFTCILLMFCSISFADQVVITPDRIESPVFKTNSANCLGARTDTHINLGFASSETGPGWYSTVGGGELNTASGFGATVSGGKYNKATKNNATVCGGISNEATSQCATVSGGDSNKATGDYAAVGGGIFNEAGGICSWAGGRYMRLNSQADHTFVWGYSENDQQVISKANAFLIFPAGTAGKVGIGTAEPTAPLHLGSGVSGGQAYIQLENKNGPWGRLGRWSNRLQIRSSDAIGFAAGGTDMSGHLWIKGNGDVGIGTTDPTHPLQMKSGAYVTTAGVWTDGSSRDYKENIRELTYDEARLALLELSPSKYNYKVDQDDEYLGFIAEDVPDLVATKDRKGLSPMDIVAVLTKVVQKQQEEIEALKALVNSDR